jgi:hypothetical protein
VSKLKNALPQEVKIGVKIGVNLEVVPKVFFGSASQVPACFTVQPAKTLFLFVFSIDPAKTCKFYYKFGSFARAPKNRES